jgi:hypothetical protein
MSLYYNLSSLIFPLSLTLSILFGVMFIFNKDKIKPVEIFMIFLPLAVTRYIFTIRFGLPSGYDDIHAHIIWTENAIINGNINFAYLAQSSDNFVGLYVYYNIVKLFTNIDIPYLAIYLQPIVDIASFIVFYKFVRLFSREKIALIALVLFGWEPVIFDFGEYRTQSFCLIFLLTFLYFIVKNKNNYNKSEIILSILLMMDITITSFVTFFICYILIFVAIFTNIFSKIIIKTKEKELFPLNKFHLLTFTILFIGYISYIGNSINNLLPAIIKEINNTFFFKYSTPNIMSSIFIDYGIGTFYIQWIVKAVIFIFTMVLFLHQLYYKKNITLSILTFTLGFLTLLGLLGSFELNSNRIYYFFIIFASITMAKGYEVINNYLSINYAKFLRVFLFFLILFFAIFSIIRLPNYIIGNTYPFRTNSTIDKLTYYDVTNKDINIGKFLNQYGINKYIYFNTLENIFSYYYPFTRTIPLYEYNINNFNNSLIIFLHDNYNGNRDYYGRDQFPTVKDLSDLNLVFQNRDMFLFYK